MPIQTIRQQPAEKIQRAIRINDAQGNLWKTVTPAEHNDHIIHLHLRPEILCPSWIPRFDIEVAKKRHIRLDATVDHIYDLLEKPISELEKACQLAEGRVNCTPETYKEMLIKTLLYIEEMKLAEIDWERINTIFPRAPKIRLNIDEDGDGSFLKAISWKQVSRGNPEYFARIYFPELRCSISLLYNTILEALRN